MQRYITWTFVMLLLTTVRAWAQPTRVAAGGQVAFATEQEMLGSGAPSGVQLLMVQPQLTIALVQGTAYPKLAVVNTVTLAESVSPVHRFIVSVSNGLRFGIGTTRRAGGYLELGAGVGSSALHRPAVPELDGWLQYHLQVGGGMRMRVGAGTVRLGYGLTHFSNNGTTMPNRGLNLHTVACGLEFPF